MRASFASAFGPVLSTPPPPHTPCTLSFLAFFVCLGSFRLVRSSFSQCTPCPYPRTPLHLSLPLLPFRLSCSFSQACWVGIQGRLVNALPHLPPPPRMKRSVRADSRPLVCVHTCTKGKDTIPCKLIQAGGRSRVGVSGH